MKVKSTLVSESAEKFLIMYAVFRVVFVTAKLDRHINEEIIPS